MSDLKEEKSKLVESKGWRVELKESGWVLFKDDKVMSSGVEKTIRSVRDYMDHFDLFNMIEGDRYEA